jgi:hypothetical protein
MEIKSFLLVISLAVQFSYSFRRRQNIYNSYLRGIILLQYTMWESFLAIGWFLIFDACVNFSKSFDWLCSCVCPATCVARWCGGSCTSWWPVYMSCHVYVPQRCKSAGIQDVKIRSCSEVFRISQGLIECVWFISQCHLQMHLWTTLQTIFNLCISKRT